MAIMTMVMVPIMFTATTRSATRGPRTARIRHRTSRTAITVRVPINRI